MDRRNTIQKELVLSAVMKLRRHVTADEVYSFIRSEHPTIAKGTVYRNLGMLADEKKITRIEIPNGPDRFDFRPERHYHLRCIRCGNLFDVDLKKVPDLAALIRDPHGMVFLDFDILFRGICPDCRQQAKEED